MKYIKTIPGPGQYKSYSSLNADGKNCLSSIESCAPIVQSKVERFKEGTLLI
jgi:hypothetical protein